MMTSRGLMLLSPLIATIIMPIIIIRKQKKWWLRTKPVVWLIGCTIETWGNLLGHPFCSFRSCKRKVCFEVCIDYSLLYLLPELPWWRERAFFKYGDFKEEHSLKRSTLQRELRNLTSQSLVISCAVLRLLSVPCPNSAPFSNDVFASLMSSLFRDFFPKVSTYQQ